MRKKSLYTSAGLHIALFTLAMVSLPWLRRDFEIPQPVSVELVDLSKVTETPKPAPVAKPPPKKEEEKKEDKPPPAAKNSADEAVVPVKEDKKEDDKKEEKKQLVDKNAPPDKKKKDDKKKKTTEQKPKKDFSSVLKNLEDRKDTTPDKQPDLKPDEAKPAPQSQNAPLGAKLTMSEEDALRHQLERCWNVPFGAKDAENLVVQIFMVINPDRTLQSARVVDTGRYNTDSFFRAAADSAMRAVRSPLCSPFDVPPDKYDTWKETTVTFNPSEMF